VSDAIVISDEEPDDPGLRFVALRDEGLRILQQLSGAIWTDYNEHDPGVTILEQLCYALTELSYRAGLPMADLLTDADGRIDPRRQALFEPIRILPAGPLTIDDYRRLLADRVPAIGNVWLDVHRGGASGRVNGLYDVTLYAPSSDECACERRRVAVTSPSEVRDLVRRVYARHRNLCEDLHSVRVLLPVHATVRATVSIDPASDPELVAAQLYYAVGCLVAPEIQREPLAAQLARGRCTSEIFQGPLLRDGFVVEAASGSGLPARVTRVGVPDVARVLARGGGVLGVRDVEMQVEGLGDFTGKGVVGVPSSGVLSLDPRLPSGDLSLRILRRGADCKVDPSRVLREVDRLWMEHRRRYPLVPDYERSFAFPRGKLRNIAGYTSIQDQFPNVYGINAYGPPDDADTLRLAQARQLKGYLIPFEQLMADFFAQLEHARRLFSIEPSVARTYARQSLLSAVPSAADVLDTRYERAWGDHDVHLPPRAEAARRNGFLDVLLDLYADRFEGGPSGDEARALEPRVQAKIALLEHFVSLSRDRARGFDYLAALSSREVSGMELRCRIELGFPPAQEGRLVDGLEAIGLALVDDAGSVPRLHERHHQAVEARFDRLAVFEEVEVDVKARADALASLLGGHEVSESFLRAAADLASFRLGMLDGESEVSLVCKSHDDSGYFHVGRHADATRAMSVAVVLVERLSALTRRAQQLYLVEHTLLRFGFRLPSPAVEVDGDAHHAIEPSFAITAVLSHASSEAEANARSVLRRNAPAHIAIEACFLRPTQMRHFEELYRALHHALHTAHAFGARPLVRAAVRLRRFLERRRRSAC
jgi:hypothetical protein